MIVNYDRKTFIVQATGMCAREEYVRSEKKKVRVLKDARFFIGQQ
jgi:hypothetical protein